MQRMHRFNKSLQIFNVCSIKVQVKCNNSVLWFKNRFFALDWLSYSSWSNFPSICERSHNMREFQQYRELTPSLSSSFFVFHCVESCFLLVSFEQDFIVRTLRLSSVLENFPVFTKRMASRTQPHITRLEDRERNVRRKKGWWYKASEWRRARRVNLVQLSVRSGSCCILLIYVSLLSLPCNFVKRIRV